ncbi:MAG: TonB-dependent siderophore receptor [Nostoc sp.]|uniref:TonB-dependent siderophore receptor n=1 Tax=Nostoc sp. TaxID=1180 RepID=UPI002FEEAA81
MVLKQILKIVLFTSSVCLCVATSVTATEVNKQVQAKSVISVLLNNRTIKEIPRLSEVERKTTSAQQLVQSPASQTVPVPEIVQVTAVKANPTSKGLEVILQTNKGQQLQLLNRSSGNSFITDIPNAQLRLPSGDAFTFRSDKPIVGVTQITVTNFDAQTIRVTVTGETLVPVVELFDSPDEGVIFSVASTTPRAQQQPQTTQQPQIQQPEAQTQPSQPSASGDEPIELVVTGEQDGYRVTDGSTATKTDTPLRDIPASIQVIPRQVIEDQGATSIREVVRNVSGVNFSTASGNRSEDFNVRGFTATQFRNGFREDFYSTRTQTDLANIERIEVLKGPASVLFGQADPAGIINFVTKQPLLNPYYNVSFTAGNYSFYRPTIDFSGSLTADKKLAYRLNAAYESAGSFRDFVDTERFIIAPTLAWQISPDTKLTAEVSYIHDSRPIDRGLVVLSNNRVADIPISRLLGAAGDGDFAETRTTLYLDHRFSSNLSLRSAFRYTSSSEEQRKNNVATFAGPLEDDRFLSIGDARGAQHFETYTFQNDLTAKFNTGSIQHTVLFGLEFARQFDSYSYIGRDAGTINIFNPDYNFTFGAFDPLPNQGKDQVTSFGVYLQDQITLLDNLKLVLGGRFDTYNDDSASNGQPTETDADAFSPRVGIVYQPIPEISLYASYTRSFTPVSGRSLSGDSFDPQRGTGYEVGVKGELANGRLSSTLAFYDITLSNILTTDPANPDFSIQVGEQRSRGIDFDIAGEILPGWKIIASYAYTDAKITEDNTFAVGNRLNNVPYNTASLWTTYSLQNGSLKGLGIGGGVFFVDARAGDLDNSFEVSSYARVDAALYYTADKFRAAINFKNLFDTTYYEGVQNRFQVYPGAPFTVQGTISWQF